MKRSIATSLSGTWSMTTMLTGMLVVSLSLASCSCGGSGKSHRSKPAVSATPDGASPEEVETSGGSTGPGSNSSNTVSMSVTGRRPLVVQASDVVTLTGIGFRSGLAIDMGGIPVDPVSVTSDTKATFVVPAGVPPGLVSLSVKQGAVTVPLSLIYKPVSILPVNSSAPNDVCSGVSYYDASGQLKVGTKTCSWSDCSSDGQTGCRTTTSFPGILVAGLGAKVLLGQTVAGVAGAVIAESHINCQADGGLGCLSAASYPAVDAARLLPSNIAKGHVVAGITGAKRDTKICRNGRGATIANGNSTTAWDGWMAGPVGTVTITADTNTVTGLSTAFTSYLAPGDSVRINGDTRGLTTVGSLTSLTVDTNWTTAAAGVGYSFHPSAHNDLTVDDYQNGVTPWYGKAGEASASAADKSECNEDGFLDVSAAVGEPHPDTTKNAAWTAVYQDSSTGLYFTNVFGPLAWTPALDLCASLNGGAVAGSGWRAPTQKELMQIYLDGVSRWKNGAVAQNVWSSSTRSAIATGTTSGAWYVALHNGFVYASNKGATAIAWAMCVK